MCLVEQQRSGVTLGLVGGSLSSYAGGAVVSIMMLYSSVDILN
jgi:hypothetical protein